MTDETNAPANPSRPPRAKRHLRLVTGKEETGDAGKQGKRQASVIKGGKVGAGKGATQGGRGEAGERGSRSAPDPITGLTVKQEAFAQGVSSGMSLSDAYRAAYEAERMSPQQIWTEASVLASSPKVARRLEALALEKERQRRMLAPADAAAALDVLRLMMSKADSDATKVRAAELLAKAAGVFTDKVEIEDKTDRSASEIEQAIADRLRRLGLAS